VKGEGGEMFSGRAWRLVKFGEPKEAIKLQEMTWGEPSPGQVLIRDRTAGAGFPDAMMTAGHFPLVGDPPFGLGEEAAGEVVAVAPGSRFAVGDQVTGITGFLEGWGGFAEYAAIRIPVGMADEQAGGFPIRFRAACAGLVERAPVEVGQTLPPRSRSAARRAPTRPGYWPAAPTTTTSSKRSWRPCGPCRWVRQPTQPPRSGPWWPSASRHEWRSTSR